MTAPDAMRTLFPSAGRVAYRGHASAHIARNDAPGPDHSIVADRHARQDDGTGANPDVAANADGASELQAGRTFGRVTGMIGCEDLHAWTDLDPVADDDLNDVEDHAVEVQKGAGT